METRDQNHWLPQPESGEGFSEEEEERLKAAQEQPRRGRLIQADLFSAGPGTHGAHWNQRREPCVFHVTFSVLLCCPLAETGDKVAVGPRVPSQQPSGPTCVISVGPAGYTSRSGPEESSSSAAPPPQAAAEIDVSMWFHDLLCSHSHRPNSQTRSRFTVNLSGSRDFPWLLPARVHSTPYWQHPFQREALVTMNCWTCRGTIMWTAHSQPWTLRVSPEDVQRMNMEKCITISLNGEKRKHFWTH